MAWLAAQSVISSAKLSLANGGVMAAINVKHRLAQWQASINLYRYKRLANDNENLTWPGNLAQWQPQ
jgi:cell division protein ZapA (FtsZ GTPase activity inhibitor)